jgi:autotransporter-associated beta strand protein
MVAFAWCGFGRRFSVASISVSSIVGSFAPRSIQLRSGRPGARLSRRIALLGSVSALAIGVAIGSAGHAKAGQLPASAFQTYDPTAAASIQPGPFSLYQVALGSLMPTQINVGLTEVGKKTAGFDLLAPSALTANLLTDIEPVVIGPGGVLYLTDGHHTFLALLKSIYGASNPNVYVDVIANFSNLNQAQFLAKMQASNFLLPLNDGVIQSVNPLTGAPIPTSFLGMSSDVYRGLEYSILKNKNSVLFPTASNITGAAGSSIPGLDKTAAFYSDFIWAGAYRGANGGLGLPYLSPADIAIATKWNLNGSNATTLPGLGAVTVSQLPGFILPSGGSITISGAISNATLANGVLDGSKTGTFDQSTSSASFNGLRGLNLGSVTIGSSAPGFIMQLGADNKATVTLSGANTYTGGTTILAGTLVITSDAALGAASPTGAAIDPSNIAASVSANNGIVFNSLTEGAGTLQISPTVAGTLASPFVLNRPIAVDGEIATINPNGNVVKLTGAIVSLGGGGTGIGNATGVSDLSINDGTGNGTVILAPTSGSNPYFYGNWIISSGTLQASSDAALGNTTGPSYSIGQIDLDGGTFQAGASFNSVRSLFLSGGSSYDTNGFTTSFAGSMTDVQRTLTILNSSTTSAGAVTFGSFNISATATLALSGGAQGESVSFTNGISRTPAATLLLQPSSTTSLGTTEKILSGTAPTLANGIAAPWIVVNSGAANNPYDFVTYGANGYVTASYNSSNITTANSASVVKQGASAALSGNTQAYAINIQKGFNVTIGAGNTLTLGDGSSPAGLILNGGSGSGLTGGTLAFGGSEGVIWNNGSSIISSVISGSGGLTFAGSGTTTLSTASTQTGAINIDSGAVTLSAANVFAGDVNGVTLSNVKSKPAAAALAITANNAFTTLNSVGSNSKITLSNGAALTIGDTTNNLGSTLSSSITESGTAVAGALTKNGSGLLDLSGMSKSTLSLISGSTVVVNGGQLRIGANIFTNANGVVLNNGSELQFAQNGGGLFANAISGSGWVHLIGGTLQLTGTNSYSGGTLVEAGSTLDLTTANVSTGNANIANAGGLVVFDQATTGTYSGVISDGKQMGTGAVISGSFVKDDSTGASSGNVTLSAVQTYTGGTFVEAGTLTLGAQNAVAASSGVDLGRVGGPAGTGAAAAGGAATAILALGADNAIQGLMSEQGNNTAVQLGGHALTINTTTSNIWSFGGAITGTGSLVKSGTGTELLTGASTYTGPTTVNGGLLALGDTGSITSQVQVNSGGALGGSGSVGSTTIASGGTLAPGSFTKALTVNGSLALASGALYVVAISPSAATTTTVTGTAALGGTVLAGFQSGSYTQIPKSYTILNSAGLGGTTFSALATVNLPTALSASLSYTATSASLNLTSGLGHITGLGANQAAVGSAIDTAFNGSSGLSGGFATLLGLSGASLPGALSQASGQPGSSQQQSTLIAASQFMNTMGDTTIAGRAGSGFGAGATGYAEDGTAANAYAANGRARSASERDAYAAIPTKALRRDEAFDPRWSVWGSAYGGSSTTDGNTGAGTNTTTSRLYGFATGADYRLTPDLLTGFALAGGGTSFSVANGLGTGRSDLFQAGGFMRRQIGAAYVSGALAYSWQDVTTNRTVTIAGADQLQARFNTNAFSGRAEGGYRVVTSWMGLTPYAALQATVYHLPGYAEQVLAGASTFALNYAAKDTTATRTELGVRTDRSFALADGLLVLRGRAAWAHDYNPSSSVTATFQNLGAASFTVNGATPARDAALTTVSAEKIWASGFSLGATFEGEFSNTTRSYAGKGVARYTW